MPGSVSQASEVAVSASQKFEYFVTGGAGAIVAFALESYETGTDFYWIAPIGWGLLLLSLAAGMYRLSKMVMIQGATVQLREAEAMLVKLTPDLLRGTGAIVHDPGTGETFPPDALPTLVSAWRARADQVKEAMREVNQRAIVAYHVRNWCLVLGLVALAVWKTLNL